MVHVFMSSSYGIVHVYLSTIVVSTAASHLVNLAMEQGLVEVCNLNQSKLSFICSLSPSPSQ